MDLSFINVPTSKPELLELLKVAYNAGQNSMTPEMLDQLVSDRNRHKKKQQKKEFKHWLKLISQQWTDLQHS